MSDFRDNVLSLFPPGAAWQPREIAETVAWTMKDVNILIGVAHTIVIDLPPDIIGVWFAVGDTIHFMETRLHLPTLL